MSFTYPDFREFMGTPDDRESWAVELLRHAIATKTISYEHRELVNFLRLFEPAGVSSADISNAEALRIVMVVIIVIEVIGVIEVIKVITVITSMTLMTPITSIFPNQQAVFLGESDKDAVVCKIEQQGVVEKKSGFISRKADITQCFADDLPP
jgi:hypothetical protein